MSLIGKLHEISMYGLISASICISMGKVNVTDLLYAGFHVDGLATLFVAYMFWSAVLFVPIAIIGAFATKYGDYGEGLTFNSNNIVVIAFAHIAEELLGIVMTPFWFLKDLFTHNFDDGWKIFDYVTYAIEIILIIIGILFCFS